MGVKKNKTHRLPDLPDVSGVTLALPRFKEFVRNLRRNEYLKIQQTQAYDEDPETWEERFSDVNDVAYSSLNERGETYHCSAAKHYKPYSTKRSTRSGEFIPVRKVSTASQSDR
jgi:hypothetical protein